MWRGRSSCLCTRHLRRASSVGKSAFFHRRLRSSCSPPRAPPPAAAGKGLEVPERLLKPPRPAPRMGRNGLGSRSGLRRSKPPESSRRAESPEPSRAKEVLMLRSPSIEAVSISLAASSRERAIMATPSGRRRKPPRRLLLGMPWSEQAKSKRSPECP